MWIIRATNSKGEPVHYTAQYGFVVSSEDNATTPYMWHSLESANHRCDDMKTFYSNVYTNMKVEKII